MYENIPRELRERRQWCLWKYIKANGKDKPTKIPFHPNGEPISSTNSDSWVSFEDAAKTLSWFDGLGFVLSKDDPYSFIDLDTHDNRLSDEDRARHTRIAQTFTGYAEISPSGKGLHLIVRGKVPQGRKRAGIEVYSDSRYMTMTGNVWRNEPIVEQPQLLNELWEELAPSAKETNGTHYESQPQTLDDWSLCERASKAVNGEKFVQLWQGKWQVDYPSQSEADFSLIDIIAYYTDNLTQVKRIFRQSALGQRDKAKRDAYIDGMVKRSFDQKPPPIDFSQIANWLPKKPVADQSLDKPEFVAHELPSDDPQTEPDAVYSVPPGLLGEIANYIYSAAPRQVPQIALCAAMGLMAGICGRAYNTVTGAGLNQYILLLAKTGSGKEAMASGISAIMDRVQKVVPASHEFIGPAEIRSDAALLKYIAKESQCFVTISGEFGQTLSQMSAQTGSSQLRGIKKVMLDLYNKSGKNGFMRSTIYSDKEKNTNIIQSPAFSFVGESAPEPFYESVDESMIGDGLLPRFTLIEYEGIRNPLNTNAHHAPDNRLIERVGALCAQSLMLQSAKSVIDVELDSDATKLMHDLDVSCTRKINTDKREVVAHLWNRTHIRALKIASLLAVGINPYKPVVDKDSANWAINLSVDTTQKLLGKFERGEVGSSSNNDSKQIYEIKRQIKLFFIQPREQVCKYLDNGLYYDHKFIPHQFLSRRLIATSAFKKDRRGSSNALKATINVMIENYEIIEAPKNRVFEVTGLGGKCYVVPTKEAFDRIMGTEI